MLAKTECNFVVLIKNYENYHSYNGTPDRSKMVKILSFCDIIW